VAYIALVLAARALEEVLAGPALEESAGRTLRASLEARDKSG